jgi:hypothetical protein
MLLGDDEYRELKRRFRSGEYPPDLDALLRRLARLNAYSGALSSRLAPGGIWNDAAVEDATQGWFEKRLLRGALAAAFDLADGARHFLNRLEINFRHYLENERERSESQNLFRRTGELLVGEPEFRDSIPEGTPGGAWWGLNDWSEPEPYQGSDETLIRLAWRTGDYDLFRYGPSSERLDPVLKTPDLKRFLITLFDAAAALLTRTHLGIALEKRFNLDSVSEVPLGGSGAEKASPTKEEFDEDAVNVAATAALAELTLHEAELLFRRFRGAKLQALSMAFGIPTSTVDYQFKRAIRVITRHSSDMAPAPKILEKLVDLLSLGTDDT